MSSPASEDTLQEDNLAANMPPFTQVTAGGLSVEQWVDETNEAFEVNETDAQLTLDAARRMRAVNYLSPRTMGFMSESCIHGNTHAPAFAADVGLDKTDSVKATYVVQVIKLIQRLFNSDNEPPVVTLSQLRVYSRSISGRRVSKGKFVRRSDTETRCFAATPPSYPVLCFSEKVDPSMRDHGSTSEQSTVVDRLRSASIAHPRKLRLSQGPGPVFRAQPLDKNAAEQAKSPESADL